MTTLKLKAKTILITMNTPITHWVITIIEPDAESEEVINAIKTGQVFTAAHLTDVQPERGGESVYEPVWNFRANTPHWVDSEFKIATIRLEVVERHNGGR